MRENRLSADSLSDTTELTQTEVVILGDTLRLSFIGEIDTATSGPFSDTIVAVMLASPHPRMEIDLGAVTFLDSSGIRALLVCQEFAAGRGCDLRVVNTHDMVRGVLRMAGVIDLLCPDDEHLPPYGR